MPKDKKRKLNNGTSSDAAQPDDLDTSKPTAVFTPKGGRTWTLSVALPGSIVANAKNHDSKTYLAGNIARALAVFSVDEIVLFNDGEEGIESQTPPKSQDTYTAFSHPSHFLAHLLSFLETPPPLRKVLFPYHDNLKTSGTLPSLDMPHHLRSREWCEYREAVTTRNTAEGSFADLGLAEEYFIPDVQIPPATRLTLKLDRHQTKAVKTAQPVNPAEPREQAGYYWGYTLRQCESLASVFTDCPYDGGYDVSIGLSERGSSIHETFSDLAEFPKFGHLLLVLGGVAGLETAATNDMELKDKGIGKSNVKELFDYWVNILPDQGSRTIRTEEALWLGLMGTRSLVRQRASR